MGFYEEYDATAELLGWLLTDVRDRVIDTRLDDPFLHASLLTSVESHSGQHLGQHSTQ
ncbi:hypothetical protein ACFVAG_24015 [Streptomyces sp. NPDC057644]|uniref:hypothetical protein n=1 Tax=Streptomyces sp. NPDC057644 TaxID=3346191 RepID=UPI00368E5F25